MKYIIPIADSRKATQHLSGVELKQFQLREAKQITAHHKKQISLFLYSDLLSKHDFYNHSPFH